VAWCNLITFNRLLLFNCVIIQLLFFTGCEIESNPFTEDGPDPAFDDFEQKKLGSNWTIYSGNVGVIDHSDIGIISKSNKMRGLGIVAWNATVFSANQYSEAVISLDKEQSVLQQVFVRRRKRDGQRYGFHWNSAHHGRWELKRDGGKGAPVLATIPAASPAPGDTIRIEVVGNSIKGFHNDVEVLSASDSLLMEPGQAGMAFSVRYIKSFPAPIIEEWSGGSL
jgi:hypothetical protein